MSRLRYVARQPAANHTRVQVLRYLIVGSSGYLLAVSVYALLLAAGAHPYPAVAVIFVLNGAFNFVLLRSWAFPSSERATHAELWRFCVVACGSLVVNYSSFALLYSVAGASALPAQAMAIIIATPVGFLANRYWSFRAVPSVA